MPSVPAFAHPVSPLPDVVDSDALRISALARLTAYDDHHHTTLVQT